MLITLAVLAAIASPSTTGPTNSICPVLGGAVTPGKSAVAKVKGREYYVCCPGCIPKLEKNPDQYLEKDGTPKNVAPKPSSSMSHDHHR